MLGGIVLDDTTTRFCKYCKDYVNNEISIYMHSCLVDDGVLICMIVPQLKIIASILIRTTTQFRGELEYIIDVLTNHIPSRVIVRNIYTSSHYVIFYYKNLSKIRGNSRYMNQDCVDELDRLLGRIHIIYNRDRDM